MYRKHRNYKKEIGQMNIKLNKRYRVLVSDLIKIEIADAKRDQKKPGPKLYEYIRLLKRINSKLKPDELIDWNEL